MMLSGHSSSSFLLILLFVGSYTINSSTNASMTDARRNPMLPPGCSQPLSADVFRLVASSVALSQVLNLKMMPKGVRERVP